MFKGNGRRELDPRSSGKDKLVFTSRFNGLPNFGFWSLVFVGWGVCYVIFLNIRYGEFSAGLEIFFVFGILFLFIVILILRLGGFLRQDEIRIYERTIEVRQLKWGGFNRYFKEYIPIDRTFHYSLEEDSVILKWDRNKTYEFNLIFPTNRSKREMKRMCKKIDTLIHGQRRRKRVGTISFTR